MALRICDQHYEGIGSKRDQDSVSMLDKKPTYPGSA